MNSGSDKCKLADLQKFIGTVDNKLVEGYEKTKLGDDTLESIVAKYSACKISGGKIIFYTTLWVMLMVLISIILNEITDTNLFILGFVLMVWIVCFYSLNKFTDVSIQIQKHIRKLQAFRDYVELLNEHHHPYDYTEKSARRYLARLATRLLDVENTIKEYRMLENAEEYRLLDYLLFAKNSREKLDQTLRIANEEFGLNVNKRDLFQEAKKHLTQKK